MLYWVMCGGSEITVVTREVFIVAFTLPAMTEVEFYGERVVENLAAFLDIDPDKVCLRTDKIIFFAYELESLSPSLSSKIPKKYLLFM